MADRPFLILTIVASVLVVILALVQVLSSSKIKKRQGSSGSSRPAYQIIPVQKPEKRLTDAVGVIDDEIPYSFDLNSPNNLVARTLKASGEEIDANTWWELIPDPRGTQAYRIRSRLSGKYVSFTPNTSFTTSVVYGVHLFTYLTVEDEILGDPAEDGTGWFYFLKTQALQSPQGYKYRIKCVEPKGFYLCTEATYPGRNASKYDHYWYYTNQTTFMPPETFQKPLHPRVVHIAPDIEEEFYLRKNIPLSGNLLGELFPPS